MASVAPTRFFPYPWDEYDGVTITPLSNIPSRVSIRRFELAAAARFTTHGTEDHCHFLVLTGSGWAEWPEQERVAVSERNKIFVLNGDSVTIGANEVLILLEIYADLMMPG